MSVQMKIVILLFLIGLGTRSVVFVGPHREGDECIYMALVDQLDRGNGYTLQGSRLLEKRAVDRAGYDRPYFFHPPGGVGLFWLSFRLFGRTGFPMVQLACFALFFWSMIGLAFELGLGSSRAGLITAGILSAFTPIMAHVSTRYWLDGPQLAFCAASAFLFLHASSRNSPWRSFAAGLLLGYAALIKITAVLIVPGLVLLAWPRLRSRRWKAPIRLLLSYFAAALLIHLPWELWLWSRVGTPFPGWAGKPSADLIATNRYVRYLTVVRSPWIYLTLVPRIVWTLLPGAFLYLFARTDRETMRQGIALHIWILTVLVFHIVMGFTGYSKVVRYVILITPATILVFSRFFSLVVGRLDPRRLFSPGKVWIILLAGAAGAALLLEIASGLQVTIHYDRNLIVPLIGGM